MYNKNHVIEEFMLDEINPSHLMRFIEGNTLSCIQPWIDSFKGIFNGQQLIYKKPFVVVKDPIRRKYILWTENYGKGRM